MIAQRVIGAAALLFLLGAAFWPVEGPIGGATEGLTEGSPEGSNAAFAADAAEDRKDREARAGQGDDAGDAGGTGGAGDAGGADDGAVLRLQLQCEKSPGIDAVPIRLQISGADADGQLFRFQTRPLRTGAEVSHRVGLPVAKPRLPLRLELLSEVYCFVPGVHHTEVTSLDDPFRLALGPQRWIPLRVVKETDGGGIEGAVIRHHSGVVLGRTDAQGEAKVATLLREEVRLLVAAEGFAQGAVQFAGNELPARRVVLRSASRVGRLEVQVLDGRGQRVPGALVEWSWLRGLDAEEPAGDALPFLRQDQADRGVIDIVSLRASSDEQGRVNIPAAFAGVVQVRASHPVHGRSEAFEFEVPADLGGGAPLVVQIRYAREAGLRVAVSTADGPLELCPLELVDGVGRRRVQAAARSDSRGEVFFGVKDLRNSFVVVRSLRHEVRVQRVEAQHRESGRMSLQVGPGRELRARLSWVVGGEIDERSIDLVDRESGVVLATREVDPEGGLSFRRVPVGRPLDLRRVADRGHGRVICKVPALEGVEGPPEGLAEGLAVSPAEEAVELGEVSAPAWWDDGGP